MTPLVFAILILSSVSVVGLVLGGIKVRGIGLGSAGVLFAGILFGHFGATIDKEVMSFAKEAGLVLFVFTIGLQLGPGIVQLWKRQGILLNGMALAVVSMGLLLVMGWQGLLGFSNVETAGLFCGATTNTPSLGAAEQAAESMQPDAGELDSEKNEVAGNASAGSDEPAGDTLASAYAVAYPGGIIGIISAMLILKWVLRVNVAEEAAAAGASDDAQRQPIERRSITIDNAHLDGLPFGEIPGLDETGVRISRMRRKGETEVHAATVETVLHAGDVVQVVGTEHGLDRFEPLIGSRSDADLMDSPGDAEFRRIVVTEPDVLNQPLSELSLDHVYQVTVTRIRRADVEMTARGSSRFHYGDIAHIVGDKESLDRVTKVLGNSVKALGITQFAPMFLGIAIGVTIGMIPIQVPGVPFTFRLGLAGGPLIAAIVFGLIGRVGKFVWYIPHTANLALRELGIISFLACAGLSAGATFFDVALTSKGLIWMSTGLVVTMVPLLAVGILARWFANVNYLTICGVVAGSMTDPPALAFANSLNDSPAATTAYAAVYPLTMILRIIAAQLIIYALA